MSLKLCLTLGQYPSLSAKLSLHHHPLRRRRGIKVKRVSLAVINLNLPESKSCRMMNRGLRLNLEGTARLKCKGGGLIYGVSG